MKNVYLDHDATTQVDPDVVKAMIHYFTTHSGNASSLHSYGSKAQESLKIKRSNVANELDSLPPIKMHCSNLAADALHTAIKNYQAKQKKKNK